MMVFIYLFIRVYAYIYVYVYIYVYIYVYVCKYVCMYVGLTPLPCQVVDWMHAIYWMCMMVLALAFRLQIYRYRTALAKTIKHGESLARSTDMRKELMKAQKDTLQTLDKIYPIAMGCVFVFTFFALVFTIVAAAKPAFLWRPWPLESLAPRYSELQQVTNWTHCMPWSSWGEGSCVGKWAC